MFHLCQFDNSNLTSSKRAVIGLKEGDFSMNQFKQFIRIAFISILLIGCQDEDQRFKDLQKKTGKFGTEGGFEAENERTMQLEADLTRRHRFFEALKGTYEGSFQTEEGEYAIRMTLVPSLPPYPKDPNRIRTIEEVTNDLTSLHFNVQVLQWNPANKLSVVSCQVEEVHPDMNMGIISVLGGTCQSYYGLLLSNGLKNIEDSMKEDDKVSQKEQAVNMALAILEGRLISVMQLRGVLQPSTNASKYEFLINRAE